MFYNNARLSAARRLPDGGDHGLVRRRRRLPADHERRDRTSSRAPARSSSPAPTWCRRRSASASTTRRWAARWCQCDISGVVDHRHPDEAALPGEDPRAVRAARAPARGARRSRAASRAPPLHPEPRISTASCRSTARGRTTRTSSWPGSSTAREFDEYKETYGQTLVCGTGWIERLGGGHRGEPALDRRRSKTGLEAEGQGAPDRRRHLLATRPTRARASSSSATRSGSRCSSSRTSPASWSARAPSAAASSRTAPRW